MVSRRRRDVWDVAVIGGGVAGLNAAWHAARRGLAAIVVEAEVGYGGQVANINALHGWPAAEQISGVALARALVEAVRALGVEIVHATVSAVAADADMVRIETGLRPLRARRGVVASGARLRKLGLPGEESLRGKGVSQCADCDGYFFRDQDVVVVGGGDAALQEALVLAGICRSVTVVVRSELRAQRVYVDQAAAKPNLHFAWDSTVEALLGNDTLNGVKLRNLKREITTEVACSGVFPFIGSLPDVGFLPPAVAREASGRVTTDEDFRTSIAALYAIGAARSGYSGQLVSAAGEAAGAVTAIARELAA